MPARFLHSDKRTTDDQARPCGASANRYLYWHLAVYRTAGQRRPSKALIRPDVADARAELTRLLGVGLVDFRMMDSPPPDRPAAAPVPVVMSEPDLEPPIAATVLTAEPVATLPHLPPELVYARGILEPPPADMLTVRGRGSAPVARIEVPRMGGFMYATAVSPRGFNVPLVMPRPALALNPRRYRIRQCFQILPLRQNHRLRN